jgi:hypothetical protein
VKFRPCGACGQLVSAADGCPHWRPNRAATTERTRRRERKLAAAPTVADFKRVMGGKW